MFMFALKKTPMKLETIIDYDELLFFNSSCIIFKNGIKLDSCNQWFEQLVGLTKVRKLNSIEMIEENKLKIKLKTTTIEGEDNE